MSDKTHFLSDVLPIFYTDYFGFIFMCFYSTSHFVVLRVHKCKRFFNVYLLPMSVSQGHELCVLLPPDFQHLGQYLSDITYLVILFREHQCYFRKIKKSQYISTLNSYNTVYLSIRILFFLTFH